MYIYDDQKKISLSWVRAVASALSREHNIKIEEGPNWSTNVKTKVIYYSKDIAYLDEDTALGLLLHEVGHIRHTPAYDEFVATKKLLEQFPEATMLSINCLEDIRVDELMSDAYDNSRAIMSDLHVKSLMEFVPRISEYSILKKYANHDLSPQDQHKAVRTDTNTPEQIREKVSDAPLTEVYGLAMAHYYLEDYAEPVMKDYYDQKIANAAREVSKKFVEHELCYMTDPQKVGEFFMQEIYPIVKPWFTQQNEQAMQKAKQKAQNNNQSPQNSNGNHPMLKQKDPKNAGQKSGKELQEAQAESPTGEDNNGVMQPFTKMLSGDPDMKNKKMAELMNKGKKPASYADKTNLERTYEESYKAISGLISGSKARFNRILKDNAYERFVGRFNSGRLNQRKLYKQKTGDYKLFQRKREIQDKDYAVSIMIDVSGSMQGAPFKHAMDGVVLFSEVFNKIGVDFEVIPFSDQYNVAKNFGEGISTRKLNDQFSKVFGGGTMPLAPYNTAIKNILAHGAQKKIVIMLTDGEFYDRDKKHIREQVRKHKSLIQYGIGLDVNLSDVFEENWVSIKNTKDIVPNFLRILSKHIRKNI